MESTAINNNIKNSDKSCASSSVGAQRRRPHQQLALLWLLAAALLLLGDQFSQPLGAQALPVAAVDENGRGVFFAALLRDADGRSSLVPLSNAPMFRFLATPTMAEQQKKRRDLGGRRQQPMLAKKYDRNCFFSPVQCTLQQWSDGNPAEEVLLGGGAGKRRRR